MLVRELEPEVMDDPAEARDYDSMDHAGVNRQFVKDLMATGVELLEVLDVGTGTARIPIELCARHATCQVTGHDASEHMLHIGRENVQAAGLESRIVLCSGDAKNLAFEDGRFNGVISNSLFHHLAEPQQALLEMIRVLHQGGLLFVRDLLRPEAHSDVERLVAQHAAGESPANQQLLRQSLLAALTVEEVSDLVRQAGLPATVSQTSDRHWTLSAIK